MFIVVEGVDGAGKSTFARRLKQRIELDYKVDALLTHEPGSPQLEKNLRAEFKRDGGLRFTPTEMAVLFTADRLFHLAEVVKPALAAGKWVVCDRYAASTWAYQIDELQTNAEDLDVLVSIPPSPHLTLFLDVDPDVAKGRMMQRGNALDSYESDVQKQLNLRANYLQALKLFTPTAWVPIDANASVDEALSQAMPYIAAKFNNGCFEEIAKQLQDYT